MSEDQQMAKVYDPSQVEEKWYRYWEESGFFTPQWSKIRTFQYCYCLLPMLPVHCIWANAMDNTLQDILTRFKRMQGYNTLCFPEPTMPELLPRPKWKSNWPSRVPTVMLWDAKSSWKRLGPGKNSMAERLPANCANWGLPVIGPGRGLHG
jgi:hypothetical protein